jgi:hypothetical protein
MNREDVRKLLGGYATGTLSSAEREALFAAALDDQELFDALMKEEALREVFEDPDGKAQLLAALEKPAAQPAWWSWRPLIGAVAMAGIALAAVAIWRGTREKPASVIVAEMAKHAAAPPTAAPPAAVQPEAPAKSRLKTETRPAVRDDRRPKKDQEKEKDNAAAANVAALSAKGELEAPAPPAAAAPPPAAPARQQQVSQFSAPSPAVQQQAIQTSQSLAVEAAPGLNRAAAGVTGFRDAASVKEASADMVMKKSVGPLQWTILRGDRETPPGTLLDAGEAVRLRIFSFQPGSLTLTEEDRTLATAQVEASKPFDTPAIAFTVPGQRQFHLSLKTTAPEPITLTITLNYAR